eukprot:Awhi_evm4s14618
MVSLGADRRQHKLVVFSQKAKKEKRVINIVDTTLAAELLTANEWLQVRQVIEELNNSLRDPPNSKNGETISSSAWNNFYKELDSSISKMNSKIKSQTNQTNPRLEFTCIEKTSKDFLSNKKTMSISLIVSGSLKTSPPVSSSRNSSLPTVPSSITIPSSNNNPSVTNSASSKSLHLPQEVPQFKKVKSNQIKPQSGMPERDGYVMEESVENNNNNNNPTGAGDHSSFKSEVSSVSFSNNDNRSSFSSGSNNNNLNNNENNHHQQHPHNNNDSPDDNSSNNNSISRLQQCQSLHNPKGYNGSQSYGNINCNHSQGYQPQQLQQQILQNEEEDDDNHEYLDVEKEFRNLQERQQINYGKQQRQQEQHLLQQEQRLLQQQREEEEQQRMQYRREDSLTLTSDSEHDSHAGTHALNDHRHSFDSNTLNNQMATRNMPNLNTMSARQTMTEVELTEAQLRIKRMELEYEEARLKMLRANINPDDGGALNNNRLRKSNTTCSRPLVSSQSSTTAPIAAPRPSSSYKAGKTLSHPNQQSNDNIHHQGMGKKSFSNASNDNFHQQSRLPVVNNHNVDQPMPLPQRHSSSPAISSMPSFTGHPLGQNRPVSSPNIQLDSLPAYDSNGINENLEEKR